MSLLLLSSGLPRIPLIRPGWISPLLSFARAQLDTLAADPEKSASLSASPTNARSCSRFSRQLPSTVA